MTRVSLLTPDRRSARVLRFALATGSGSLLALSRLAFQGVLGANSPFLLAWPGMMLAAFIGGFWPTMVVTIIGAAVGQVVLVRGGAAKLGVGGLIIFIAFGVVFALAGEARLRGIRQAQRDAARLAEMQLKMMQVSRLNALGEMAGSLAHELNQPLTAIINYANAARQLLGDGRPTIERPVVMLDKIVDQAERASRIVARSRAAVDRGAIEPVEESVVRLVQEAVDIALVGDTGARVAVRYEFDHAADRVLADRIQVQQVILNLVRNAAEAMAASPRRELRIGSRADPTFVDVYVADTGPGVSAAMAERLFQPFVSGKPDGMGVGLSISRNIIEAHGGKIWADANPDGGATFHFSLKRAEVEAQHA